MKLIHLTLQVSQGLYTRCLGFAPSASRRFLTVSTAMGGPPSGRENINDKDRGGCHLTGREGPGGRGGLSGGSLRGAWCGWSHFGRGKGEEAGPGHFLET